MVAYNGAASDSDGSSFVSYGSTPVSLEDSYYSDRENRVCSTDDLTILDAGPAPPDYNQATAHRNAAQTRPADEESLYAASERNPPRNGSLPAPKPQSIRRFLRQHWKRICLLNLLLYSLLATVLLCVGLVLSRKTTFRQSDVVQRLDIFPPDHPLNNRFHQERFHKNTTECVFTSFPEDFSFFGWLDPDDFSFEESLLASDYANYHNLDNVSITGNVEVRPAPYGSSEAIEVIISYAANSAWRAGIPDWHFNSNLGSLKIQAPLSPDPLVSQDKGLGFIPSADPTAGETNGRACLDVWVGIYVQTQLDNFNLETENLHIDIGSFESYQRAFFSFRIRNESHIHTQNGNITTSDWDARNANFTSESGSIKGEFGLNDNLHLRTESGDIVAEIWQKAAHEKKYLDTHPPGTPANLTTTTGSGKQSISIDQGLNEIYWGERLGYGYPFLLQSLHHSSSGVISVAAGMYWGGKMHATSNRGSIDLSGVNVQIGPGPVDDIARGDESSNVWASKGVWDSSMLLETRDGDIRVCVEDEQGYQDEMICRYFLPDLNRVLYPDWPEMWGDKDAKM